MTEFPMVSIIVPTYNSGKYIDKQLQCLYNQKYKDWEAIIIDDGSIDNTKDIVSQWIKLDNRFKYFYQNNSGVSSARNKGIDYSKGKYMVFVDADDEITDNFILDFINNVESSDTLLIQDIDRYMPNKTELKYLSFNNEKIKLKVPYSSKIFVGYAVNKFYDTNIIRKYNIKFDEDLKIREDEAFFFEYLKYIKYIKTINKSNYNYITRTENASEKLHHFKQYLKIIDNFNKFINSGFIIKDRNNQDLCVNYTIIFNNFMKSLGLLSSKERLRVLKDNHNKILFPFVKYEIKRFNFIVILYRVKLYNLFNYFWYRQF